MTPIARVWKNERIVSEATVIGIINPVFYICAPNIVLKFLDKLEMPNVEYLFFALTRGLSVAHGAASQMKSVLKSKGYRANSAWYFTMDQTYRPIYCVKPDDKRKTLFDRAYEKIDRVSYLVKKRKCRWEFNHSDLFYRINQKIFFREIFNEDRKFYLSNRCNGCGTCKTVCPVSDIEMTDGRPHWLHQCESCQACVHFCPQGAIEVMGARHTKGVTEGKRRITHPDVCVNDMKLQKTP